MMIKTTPSRHPLLRACLAGVALTALTACESGFDADMRNLGGGFNTTDAARNATANRPRPDARGVISYPTYQVAVAKRGDTVGSVAARVGLSPEELARYNAVAPNAELRDGEVLALPRRVSEPSPTAGAPGGAIDVTTLATGAIDRAEANGTATATSATGAEPTRHRVVRGETAYSIARAYNVPVRSLADWNGLGTDLNVREGQFLLIPVANAARPAIVDQSAPGAGSNTPEPPSASKPLPAETTSPASEPTVKPATPDLGADRTAAAQLGFPAQGSIIRPYQKGKNEGIDISAAAGAPVKAAESGVVAAITQDTEQVPILVIKHDNGLLTVYANIDGITVAKGAKVKRGQTIAKVRAGDPSFVHFEVRKGFDSVDPMPYLQ